jgi:hypothetical protein
MGKGVRLPHDGSRERKYLEKNSTYGGLYDAHLSAEIEREEGGLH